MIAACSSERLAPRLIEHPGLGPVTAWPVGNQVGESPAWHAQEQALYWIDVRAPELLRLEPGGHLVTRWRLPDVVGAVALRTHGRAWLALRHSLAEIDLGTGRLREVAAVEADMPTNRLNDGKVSPSGRWFVFGSMDDRAHKEPTGGLYRAGADGHVERLADGLVVANGIAFGLDGGSLYFSDSSRGLVMRADWDEVAGRMGRPSIIAVLGEESGRPDGAAIDPDGCYWSAGVSAGVLNKLGSDGRLRTRLHVPCRAPTMAAYGGAGGATLFVTSLVRPQWTAPGPLDGALIAFKAPAPGRTAAVLA
jgi:sugar lactone lactonase YvrE